MSSDCVGNGGGCIKLATALSFKTSTWIATCQLLFPLLFFSPSIIRADKHITPSIGQPWNNTLNSKMLFIPFYLFQYHTDKVRSLLCNHFMSYYSKHLKLSACLYICFHFTGEGGASDIFVSCKQSRSIQNYSMQAVLPTCICCYWVAQWYCLQWHRLPFKCKFNRNKRVFIGNKVRFKKTKKNKKKNILLWFETGHTTLLSIQKKKVKGRLAGKGMFTLACLGTVVFAVA